MNKLIGTFLASLLITAIVIAAVFNPENDFAIITLIIFNILNVITILFTHVSSSRARTERAIELRENLLQDYRDGKHLPPFLDHIFYSVKIGVLFLGGWYLSALTWVGMYYSDFHLRKQSTK